MTAIDERSMKVPMTLLNLTGLYTLLRFGEIPHKLTLVPPIDCQHAHAEAGVKRLSRVRLRIYDNYDIFYSCRIW